MVKKMSNYRFSLNPQKVKKVFTRYRSIQTKIPEPNTKKILYDLSKYESRSMHGQLPIIWHSANNFNIFDQKKNKWIDFTSTIFVTNVGHSNKRVVNAMKNVLEQPLYSCYAYGNKLRSEYLKKLINFAGNDFEKAFLLSAGTEATEAALKLMRMYGQKEKKKRLGIICFQGNWHGRTLGAQLMSGNIDQKKWIGFDDNDIHHLPFPYPWDLNDCEPEEFLSRSLDNLRRNGIDIKSDICGFMLETFQGWGAIFYPKEFVKKVENICKKNNILLAFDEMQSGFGRTGKKFGYEHYEVKPDLLCCGKGMGGGIPLSGVLGKAKILDLPEVGNMSSTHSANPLSCAAGLAVIEELTNKNLTQKAQQKGIILFEGLNKLKYLFPNNIKYILGKGLIASIIFKSNKTAIDASILASKISEKCMQKGLLVVHTGRESIKIGPPLTIPNSALKEGISVIEEAIKECI